MIDKHIVEFEFPSGRKAVIEVSLQAQRERAPQPKIAATGALKHACKHVGQAIDVPEGCGGSARGKWECAIYGVCRPLAPFRGSKALRSCEYCESYEPADDPSITEKIKNYGSALARWANAGAPRRTQQEINHLFAICSACPFLRRTDKGSWCGKCGCPISVDRMAAFNKLAMATESCPLDPPRWTAIVAAPRV